MLSYFLTSEKKREREWLENYVPHPEHAMEVYNINFYYGSRKIVDDFNFNFKKGKIYTILGAAGSGKSTLASHFNGLLKSDTANIFLFNGQNIYKFKKKISNFREIRRTVGMVLQNPEYQLFKETVLEDVCCGLRMLRSECSDIENRSKEKLLELGIGEEFFYRNPFMLSGGQKKKVALAGILVIDPEIIIFDEPVLGLDPFSCRKIMDMIVKLKESGKTVIVISNNIDLLLELGDELLVLDRGKLIAHGNPYTIFQDKRLGLGMPKIIQFIQKLTFVSSKFDSLWVDQPKNYVQLAISITHVLRK